MQKMPYEGAQEIEGMIMPELDEKNGRFSTTPVEEKIKRWIDDDYRIEARRNLDTHGNPEFTDRMMYHGRKK